MASRHALTGQVSGNPICMYAMHFQPIHTGDLDLELTSTRLEHPQSLLNSFLSTGFWALTSAAHAAYIAATGGILSLNLFNATEVFFWKVIPTQHISRAVVVQTPY